MASTVVGNGMECNINMVLTVCESKIGDKMTRTFSVYFYSGVRTFQTMKVFDLSIDFTLRRLQNIIRLLGRLDQRLSEAVPGIKAAAEPVQISMTGGAQSSEKDKDEKDRETKV